MGSMLQPRWGATEDEWTGTYWGRKDGDKTKKSQLTAHYLSLPPHSTDDQIQFPRLYHDKLHRRLLSDDPIRRHVTWNTVHMYYVLALQPGMRTGPWCCFWGYHLYGTLLGQLVEVLVISSVYGFSHPTKSRPLLVSKRNVLRYWQRHIKMQHEALAPNKLWSEWRSTRFPKFSISFPLTTCT